MKKFFNYSGLAILLLASVSCKKQGCTDTFADNYSEEAEADDGSCSYSQDVIYYLNDARYTYYDDKSDFYAPFHFYLDGTKIGELSISSSTFQTYSSAPGCTTTDGVFKYTHTMDSKSGDLTIDIKDQLGNEHGSISANISISSGDCATVLL